MVGPLTSSMLSRNYFWCTFSSISSASDRKASWYYRDGEYVGWLFRQFVVRLQNWWMNSSLCSLIALTRIWKCVEQVKGCTTEVLWNLLQYFGIHLKGCWMLNLAKVFFSSLLGLLKSEIVERHSKDKSTISINGTVERVTHLKLARLSNIIISGKELCSRVNLFLYLRCRNIILLGSDYCLHIYSEGLMSKIFKLIKRTYFTLARLM